MAYPDRLEDVQRLIEQHRELEHQPLLLAIYFAQHQDPEGVYLLEIISQFGYNEVSDDKELFEIEYASTSGFPLTGAGHLHILLTNPVEFQVALDQDWPSLAPVLEAAQRGECSIIHSEGAGAEFLKALTRERVAA